VQLGKLSPQRVREFWNAKSESGLSPRTVKQLLVTLRGALDTAVKDGLTPLPAVCVDALVKQKSQQDADREWAGSRWQETGYVFTTRRGAPMDPRDLLHSYHAITKFPAIRFHDLRCNAATILLAQGVSPPVHHGIAWSPAGFFHDAEIRTRSA
jgi:hypothetical protein